MGSRGNSTLRSFSSPGKPALAEFGHEGGESGSIVEVAHFPKGIGLSGIWVDGVGHGTESDFLGHGH